MAETETPGLDGLVRVLESYGVAWSGSAVHGLLTGRVVADAGTTREELLDALGEMDAGPGHRAEALHKVLEGCRLDLLRRLRGEECDFEPFLPADVESLEQRTRALAAWVDGFLGGLGQSPRLGERVPTGQAAEILRDLAEIARVDDEQEESEANEQAFSDLVEYVRVGVMLLAAELLPDQAATGGTSVQ